MAQVGGGNKSRRNQPNAMFNPLAPFVSLEACLADSLRVYDTVLYFSIYWGDVKILMARCMAAPVFFSEISFSHHLLFHSYHEKQLGLA